MAKKMRLVTPKAVGAAGICYVLSGARVRMGGGGDLPWSHSSGGWSTFLNASLVHVVFDVDVVDVIASTVISLGPDLVNLGPIDGMSTAFAPELLPTWIIGPIPAGVEGPGWGAIEQSGGLFASPSNIVHLYQSGAEALGVVGVGTIANLLDPRDLIIGVAAGDLLVNGGPVVFPLREAIVRHVVEGVTFTATGVVYVGIEDRAGNVSSARELTSWDDGLFNSSTHTVSIAMAGDVTLFLTAEAFEPYWTLYDAAAGGRALFRAPLAPAGSGLTLRSGQGVALGPSGRIPVEVWFP